MRAVFCYPAALAFGDSPRTGIYLNEYTNVRFIDCGDLFHVSYTKSCMIRGWIGNSYINIMIDDEMIEVAFVSCVGCVRVALFTHFFFSLQTGR